MAPGSWSRTLLGGETGEKLGGDLQLKAAEKEFTIAQLCSKKREVRDVGSGRNPSNVYSQGDRNFKAIWVRGWLPLPCSPGS